MEQGVSPSLFTHITEEPIDPIFGLNDLFRNDTRLLRINLTYGICLEEDGSFPRVLQAVKRAEQELFKTEKTKNYLPIDGDPEYIWETGKFIFGKHYDTETIYGAQTTGGTAALRTLCDFIKKELSTLVSVSNPTWANHTQILESVGLGIDRYPYWTDGRFDFQRLYDHLALLPKKSVVQLQPMSHNPTGIDLSLSEWKELSELFHQKELLPFFDSAYQGLGKSVHEDVAPIHLFLEEDHEFLLAHSYSKSMSLYGERVGALYIRMRNGRDKERIERSIRALIRTQYSNPPRHGSSIVKTIFSHKELYLLWREELEATRARVESMRTLFTDRVEKALKRDFSYINKGCGLFTLLGLTLPQIERLREKHAIYVTRGSRINLAALNQRNMDQIIQALEEVSR